MTQQQSKNLNEFIKAFNNLRAERTGLKFEVKESSKTRPDANSLTIEAPLIEDVYLLGQIIEKYTKNITFIKKDKLLIE